MSEVLAENIYFTATGEEGGKPLIFRSLKDVPEGSQESQYPYLVSIIWRYVSANEGGMPDEQTNNAQIDFEDALEHLDKSDVSHLMLVVTGNGRKEWHWYVKSVDNWMEKLNSALQDKPIYPLEIDNRYQADWKLYHQFVSGVKGI